MTVSVPVFDITQPPVKPADDRSGVGMSETCIVVAENVTGLVVARETDPLVREQLAYADRMAAQAAYHRDLADKYDHLAEISTRRVTVVS